MINIKNKKKIMEVTLLCIFCIVIGIGSTEKVQRINKMIKHINIPTVTKTNEDAEKDYSAQNKAVDMQQHYREQNKEIEITIEQAKDMALERAGLSETQVYFKEEKLDFDDGRWKYEIEFIKDYVEYEAEIDAQTGIFYKWKVDSN